MVEFGWSASCIVEAIKTAEKIRRAMQTAGGAEDHYSETIAFLSQVDATFNLLEEFIREHPDSRYAHPIVNQLKLVEIPWNKLESDYINKYEKSLSSDSTRSKPKRVPRKVQWALENMGEEVKKLKNEILGPLGMIDSWLLLETMRTVGDLNEKCQQIIDGLQLANISDTLERGFQELQEATATHETTHDEQREVLESLRWSIAQQHKEISAALVNEASAASTSRLEEREAMASILNITENTASALTDIEDLLWLQQTSNTTLIDGLQDQRALLKTVERNLHDLTANVSSQANHHNTKPGGKGLPDAALNFVTVGRVLAAVALGLTFVLSMEPVETPELPASRVRIRPRVTAPQSSVSLKQDLENQAFKGIAPAPSQKHPQWITEFNTTENTPDAPDSALSSKDDTSTQGTHGSEKSGKYTKEGGVWFCCTCCAGPHFGWHCFCANCGHRCEGCKIKCPPPPKPSSTKSKVSEKKIGYTYDTYDYRLTKAKSIYNAHDVWRIPKPAHQREIHNRQSRKRRAHLEARKLNEGYRRRRSEAAVGTVAHDVRRIVRGVGPCYRQKGGTLMVRNLATTSREDGQPAPVQTLWGGEF
ncbi:hypothetical protein CC78DRAFT_603772 [Lojkania enalia]|uniref:Fungal N-terminal domain-containing protein n=1 Tax=Lojkania enalia TaxID=147567 RepID=A0A9P4N3G4_9PLEO|nr:hypothetical protein CC78DRAFT_603772 [Didymosphaeria enalia]